MDTSPARFIARAGCWNSGSTPDSPYHKPVFTQDKKFVFFCAGGMRSALAAQTAKQMGLTPVAHIEGGYKAWKEAGGVTAAWVPKTKAAAAGG